MKELSTNEQNPKKTTSLTVLLNREYFNGTVLARSEFSIVWTNCRNLPTHIIFWTRFWGARHNPRHRCIYGYANTEMTLNYVQPACSLVQC